MGRLVIRGGRFIDPSIGVDKECDVAVQDGKIVAIGEIAGVDGDEVFDASGKIVTAGLVDMHVHCYPFCTPIGVDPDHYCLGRGVTTAVDAGSAGATTLAGLKHFVADYCSTRLLAFLNISMHGLASAGCTGVGTGGELDSLNQVHIEQCVKCIQENRDICVGVKVRLSADAANDGKNEAEALRRAAAAAAAAGVPLMTHHTFSSVPLGSVTVDGAGAGEGAEALGCPGSLRKGDIYTHTFHGFPSTIIDTEAAAAGSEAKNPGEKRKREGAEAADGSPTAPKAGLLQAMAVHPACVDARERGVLFDVGLGQGSFNWTVAEIAIRQGFYPDVISTDLHTGGAEGPTYDLPTTMTRFLYLGMPLADVIAACTVKPAEAIGWGDRIGTLAVGREADITVLDMLECDVELEDCQGQLRPIRQRLVAAAAWRAGVRAKLTKPKCWPNPEARSSAAVGLLLVHDGCC
jgi:dihydroorotase